MNAEIRGFGSDNHAPAHPQILESIIKANSNHSPSYGTDDWTKNALKLFKKYFGPQSETFFVFNGTGANVSALRALAQSFQATLCTDISHIWVDECGAPELSACKLIPIPHRQGKLTIENLERFDIRKGDQHYIQNKVISITQPTELGTCYSLEELKAICDWAKKRNYFIHMDGARITHAVQFLKTDFFQMTTALGIDVVSFGGTKNGFLFGEAVIFLNAKNHAQNFKFIRKQLCQLPSKTRFIACQFESYFTNDLWRKISNDSCQMAELLYSKLQQIPEIQITQPRQSNAVFAIIPKSWIKPLRENYFFYVWDEHSFECRLMTSWDTTEIEITGFIEAIENLRKQGT